MPPSSTIDDIEDINGAFQLEVTARFDDLSAGLWQRVFDFGSGPASNNILLAQFADTDDIMFYMYQAGTIYSAIAQDAIVEGETAQWTVGIDPDGTMWIDKDGERLVTSTGVVPDDVVRSNEFLGISNWAADTDQVGAVMGLDIINATGPDGGSRLNQLEDINGAFRVDLTLRTDETNAATNQTIVRYESATSSDRIELVQLAGTDDIRVVMIDGGSIYTLTARGAVTEGEWACWSFGVDSSGTLWLEKDGVPLGERTAHIPGAYAAEDAMLGASNAAGWAPLDGVILDLAVRDVVTTLPPSSPVPPEDNSNPGQPDEPDTPTTPNVPTPPGAPGAFSGPIQIEGAFTISMTARFDDIGGGYFQRFFDFADGPSSNNLLFTQVENTTDVVMELWQDDVIYRVFAPNALVEGELADWRVGIDDLGIMWIEKNGVVLASAPGDVPSDNVVRANLLLGQSNWAEDTPLIGEVANFHVDLEVDVTDPVDPVPPPVGGTAGDMLIVAHQDDDLLFMNPTLHTLIDGPEPVTTVYLTAGDAAQTAGYWGGRETGIKASYAEMAGVSDWVDETVTFTVAGGASFDVASSYLASAPDVRLFFLRLPDGFGDGSGAEPTGFQSLEQLWENEIPSVTAVNGSETYTRQQLIDLLTEIMETMRPDHIHIQDHTTVHAAIEHSDHLHSAEFATAALQNYNTDLTVTSYIGYGTWGLEENLTPAEITEVRDIFLEYAAYDAFVFNPDGSLIASYEEWVMREYIADEYEQASFGGGSNARIAPPLAEPEDQDGVAEATDWML